MKPPRLKTLGPRLKPIDTRTVRPPPKITEDFYGSSEWKAVRAQVLQRDHYKCVKCGRREGRLFVDHIVERKDGGADLDTANLETLCASHHTEKTHAEAVKRGVRKY
jgi:5-methylcytosine-specific restriction protein A